MNHIKCIMLNKNKAKVYQYHEMPNRTEKKITVGEYFGNYKINPFSILLRLQNVTFIYTRCDKLILTLLSQYVTSVLILTFGSTCCVDKNRANPLEFEHGTRISYFSDEKLITFPYSSKHTHLSCSMCVTISLIYVLLSRMTFFI